MCIYRLDLLLQRANKIQNMSLDCEEKLTLAKNTLQAVSAEPLSLHIHLISSHTHRVPGFMLGNCLIIWPSILQGVNVTKL